MIHKVGLLPKYNTQQVPFAYKMYTTADDRGWKQSNAFKKTFSNDVDIEFVGVWLVFNPHPPFRPPLPKRFFSFSPLLIFFLHFVFRDTVNSCGLIPRRLPFTTSNTVVSTFRHAVSLDERRAKFKANLWNRPQKKEELLSISDQKIAEEAAKKGKSNNSLHHSNSLRMLENEYAKNRATPTDIDEVRIVYFICIFFFFGGGVFLKTDV